MIEELKTQGCTIEEIGAELANYGDGWYPVTGACWEGRGPAICGIEPNERCAGYCRYSVSAAPRSGGGLRLSGMASGRKRSSFRVNYFKRPIKTYL